MSDLSEAPPPSRSEATRRRQQAILDAALDVFTSKGVEQTTIDDIRTTANVSIGSLYHHFTNKDGIVDTLCLQAATEWQTVVLNALTRQRDPRRGIDRAVAAHFHFLDTQGQIMGLLLRRPIPADPVMLTQFRNNYNTLIAELRAWLDHHTASGPLGSISPDICATIICGPLLEHARNYLMGRDTLPPVPAAKALSDRIWAALCDPGHG